MKSRPRMLMCPLCGREFGSKSLPIHYPQCTKKWLDQEASKPAHERRPLPVLPDALAVALAGGIVPTSSKEVQAFNEQMVHKFETESLHHCSICGRSFNDKAFRKHQELCTPYKPFRPKGTGLGSQSLSTKLQPGMISGTQHRQSPIPGHSDTGMLPTDPLPSQRSLSERVSTPRPGGQHGSSAEPFALAKAGCAESPRAKRVVVSAKGAVAQQAPVGLAALTPLAPVSVTTGRELPELLALPRELQDLAEEVCGGAVGAAGTAALVDFLRAQHVATLADVRFLQLDWLLAALQPKGLSALLLNKFLTLAKQRAGVSPID